MSKVHPNLPFERVVVHPLVLLSVVDHFNRVHKTQKVGRVVGLLLGSVKFDKSIDIANCFAVPYDEDPEDPNIFFIDADYLEEMFGMFYKVAAREKIVGWYHTGPKLCKNDTLINEVIKRFTPNPVLVIIQAAQGKQDILGLPTDAYLEVEEVHDDGTPPIKTFEHVSSEIGAEEAEEVGVEHLLRDIKNQTAGTLSQRITNQLVGLRGFENHLAGLSSYLHRVARNELPINHAIVFQVQEMLNLLPDVLHPELVDAHNIQTNDHMMSIYLGNLVRTVIALHNLIDNKLTLQKAAEKAANKKKKAAEDEKKAADEKKAEKLKEGEKAAENTDGDATSK